jgi:hypothetical protein
MLACSLVFILAVVAAPESVEVVDVAPVWAGHPVGFALLTAPPRQYVAFYDAERRMTVAVRSLDSPDWSMTVLPSSVKWDSHNNIVMTADDSGRLHLSGNMHGDPLVYFRTREPWDITTFEPLHRMTGEREKDVTYPSFMRGPGGDLLFAYRSGGSGNGDQIYNRYDHGTQTWTRLTDAPLTDGEGERNAYFSGPRPGPDGYWHLCWVWRDTYDCATNHSPSYARSRDLVHWERSDGTPLTLPITLATSEVVDPVPPGGGIINGNVHVGWDADKRLVIAYHKYDADGNTQVFNARREGTAWRLYQVTDWSKRWDFSGGGTIPFAVRVQPPRVEEGRLVQSWSTDWTGSETWVLDPETLKPVELLPEKPSPLPPGFNDVRSSFPGMQVRSGGDSGGSGDPAVWYTLRWETLGQNRDHPREKPWPEPSMLQLYCIRRP